MNESAILAEYVANTVYEDLPERAIEMTKMSLLDAVGVTLAAGGLCAECAAFVEIALESSGKKESTILGFGDRVPAHMAAFANGAMAHALDFEDAHDLALVHPNAATVPAALAMAESIGNVHGKDLITSLAVGCDIVCRLGLAFNENPGEYGWYIPPILGSFGAAAAAGKLLNLDETGILDTFSLTLCQSTCSAELRFSPHSDIRSVRDAFAAKAGVLAARLAQKGVKGFDHPFEGKAGLFSLYSKGNYDGLRLIEGLGTTFEGAKISFKPWPACRGTHTYIEAALHILKENALAPDDIVDVRVVISSFNRMLCEPEDVKKAPQTVIDAKFSIPFTVATALYYKEVGLEHFTPDRLKDQNVQQLAQKIRFDVNPDLGLKDATRGYLEIRTKDNQTYAKRIDRAYGHPDNPVSRKALVAKFMSCADKAKKKIPEEKLKELVKHILALEEIKDIRQIAALLINVP